MRATIVVLDACVLYPASLRDILLELSVEGLLRPRWSEAIHDEWIRNLLKNAGERGITREALERTRKLMDAAVPEGLVTGYEPLIPPLKLPDADDRHVLAAAIHAGAEAIITTNLKDFPARRLVKHGIRALHPDGFLCALAEAEGEAVWRALRRLRERLKKPPRSVEEYVEIVGKLPLPRFVEMLRRNSAAL
jgi:hypothetical protein